MTRRSVFIGVLIVAMMAATAPMAQHTPVAAQAQCRSMGPNGPGPYAPLPVFVLTTVGSPVTTWPSPGQHDFCAHLDTAFCSAAPLGTALNIDEVDEFAGLIMCLSADINGPINPEADIPVTPNGMPDGRYELAILAKVLNTPGHALHAEVLAGYQENFMVLKDMIQGALAAEGYLGLLPLVVPHLVGALTSVLAGFATMGDEQTNGALDELLLLLEDIGLTPPEGGIAAITTGFPALGPNGDIDGDGYTNFMEYTYFVGEMGYSAADYVNAAFDANQKPPRKDPNVRIASKTYFIREGGSMELRLVKNNFLDLPEYIRWYKDGVYVPEWDGLETLSFDVVDASDSGVYKVEVGLMVVVEDKATELVELTAYYVVNVSSEPLPVGGALGLAMIAGACALAGAMGIRRRK